MKRKLMCLLCVLCVLCLLLCGCGDEPTAPQEPTYHAYELYYMEASNHVITAPKPTKLPDMFYERTTEQNIAPITVTVNGETIEGRYLSTARGILALKQPVRQYTTDYGLISFDQTSTVLMGLGFSGNEKFAALEATKTEVLGRGQCKSIANDFIASVYPQVNLDDYAFSETDLIESGGYRYYQFSYEKSFVQTPTCDSIAVAVTEHGNVMRYQRGDAIDKGKLHELGIDRVRIQELIGEYADTVCEKRSGMTYKVEDEQICKLSGGVHAWHARIVFVYSQEHLPDGYHVGDTDYIRVVIPLETA